MKLDVRPYNNEAYPMRNLIAAITAMLCVAIASLALPHGISKRLEDRRLDPLLSNRNFLASLEKLDGFVRVTEKPFLMHAPTATQCVINTHVDVHGDRFCDVYVSKDGEAAIRAGAEKYPIGTLVIKSKYPDEERSKVELYTVMRKMPEGYWPEHGDWEFSVVDSEKKHVLARGRVESCADCHDAYSASGYLTRTYMREKVTEEQ
jgi:hypothetical protein